MSRSRALVLSATLVLVVLATAHSGAQASNWDALVGAARKEGRVVYYTNSVQATNDRVKADFERLHPGIRLEVSRIAGPPLLAKLEQERQTGADGADVFNTIEIQWIQESAKKGYFVAPKGPAAKGWPQAFMVAGSAPVLAIEPHVLVYNANLVKTPVSSFADLAKPEFKGRLGLSEHLNSPGVVAWFDFVEKVGGPGFLERLAAQRPRMYVGGVTAVQAAASGELAIVGFSGMVTPVALVAQGAPLKIVLPKPTMGFRYGSGIVAWAKRPNAAQLLMNYLLSERGQTAINGKGESASPLDRIPGALDRATIQPYDPAIYTPDVMKAKTSRIDRLFKRR